MSSMFDGALIEYAAASLFEMRRKPGKEAILMAWNVEERARLWLEAWRLSLSGWHISVLADPIEAPRPELFPTQTLIVWTGMAPTRRQNELYNTGVSKVIKSSFMPLISPLSRPLDRIL